MPRLWTLSVIFLCFTFSTNLSQGKHHRKLPSGVVVGTLYCNTGMDFPKSIPGASVAVECRNSSSIPSFHQEVKTNKRGEFHVRLPFSVHRHVDTLRNCSIRMISSNKPFCDVPAMVSSSLHVKSIKHGKHIFSPDLLTFRPSSHPPPSDQNPSSTANFKNKEAARHELSPISNPNKANQPIMPSQLPPNPFNPPMAFPPYPFQQPPPPSFFPPNPNFQPPSSMFPPFSPSPPAFYQPPVPSLVPPPPQAYRFPFPFPRFPFQPLPGFPGAPPAKVSASSRP